MYLQDVFTEDEYKQIVDDIQQRKCFDYKYFKFGKASFSIMMHELTFIGVGEWEEDVLVHLGWGNAHSGSGCGENPNAMLEYFKTYSDACRFIDKRLINFVKPEDKYQGLKVETQMNMFDLLE